MAGMKASQSLLSFALAVMLSSTGWARIGESLDSFQQRYGIGKDLAVSEKLASAAVQVFEFQRKPYRILVAISESQGALSISFFKRGRFDKAELAGLVDANCSYNIGATYSGVTVKDMDKMAKVAGMALEDYVEEFIDCYAANLDGEAYADSLQQAARPANESRRIEPAPLPTSSNSQLAKDLIGTWVRIGGGPEEGPYLKMFTGRHWTVSQADPSTGRTIHFHGGTYTLNGNEYMEANESSNESTAYLLGKTLRFKMILEGDTLTQIGIDNPYTESFKRVTKTPL
jgi:hypothetical protein